MPLDDQRPQDAVRRGVADQDPAEQRLAVVGDDQLLVDARRRRRRRPARARPSVVANASPKRRHVDAEQLELGGHVGAGERRRAAEQRVGDDLGHRVAGRDQAVHPAAGRAHSPIAKTCGSEVRHCSSTSTPPRSADRPARPPRASSSRGRMPAEKTTTSVSIGLPVRLSRPRGRPSVLADDLLGRRAGVHARRPSSSMWPPGRRRRRRRPARGISRGAISTTWVSRPELDQRVGRLQAEQPAADHDAAVAPAADVADRLEVLDRAVDEAARPASLPGHRRHERRGAGGQHQRVVRDHLGRR